MNKLYVYSYFQLDIHFIIEWYSTNVNNEKIISIQHLLVPWKWQSLLLFRCLSPVSEAIWIWSQFYARGKSLNHHTGWMMEKVNVKRAEVRGGNTIMCSAASKQLMESSIGLVWTQKWNAFWNLLLFSYYFLFEWKLLMIQIKYNAGEDGSLCVLSFLDDRNAIDIRIQNDCHDFRVKCISQTKHGRFPALFPYAQL